MPQHTLTGAELDVLWEALPGAGPTPPALSLPSPGRTHRERRRLRAAVWQGLRDRGLATTSGLDPELARLLGLLAHPERQLELRARWGDCLRGLAADRAGRGALAVRRGDTVHLVGCASPTVALLGVLPAGTPGPGRACTVPTTALVAALAAGRRAGAPPSVPARSAAAGTRCAPTSATGPDLAAALVARGVPMPDARLLGRMLGPVQRRAQVVALARDRHGELRRRGGVLSVLEGPRGRYVGVPSSSGDGPEWTTVAPTDARLLRHRISALLAPVGSTPGP